MREFNYFQPTEIRFGRARIKEVGEVVSKYGKKCLLVTVKPFPAMQGLFEKIKALCREAGVEVYHFDGVVPNPTTDSVNFGTEMAIQNGVDVVLGVGGGSSMDTAKAIAVGATHEGEAWDYLYFKKTPTEKTLPIIAVPITSGTGSQVTQVAVMTETATHTKSAIYHPNAYARVAIVDPELMLTVPRNVTASTGFDVFTHAFEAFIHVGGNPYVDILAIEAANLVKQYLPVAVKDGLNIDARVKMAWADTLAGLCIASAGVTLPHGIGMTIGGFCPHVMHGQALAVTYPEFTRFTWESAVEKFAVIGRILNPDLEGASDKKAAEACCGAMDSFLKDVEMWLSFEKLNVSEGELVSIADNSRVLPDYKNNPRIAGRDDIYEMLKRSYSR